MWKHCRTEPRRTRRFGLKFLDIIAIEAARLKRLIEDILIISDIENKREVNTDSDINVRESIEEILASMEPIIEAKKVKIVTYYAYEFISAEIPTGSSSSWSI